MLQRVAGWSVLLMSAFVLTACPGSSGGNTLEKIRTDNVAYVATVPFEPPLLYQREGELVGPDAEIGNRIVERINATEEEGSSPVRLTWINRTYPNLLTALRHGEVDFVLGVFAITEERRQEINFSEPYYTSELVLVVNPVQNNLDTSGINSASIGVREGTGGADLVRELYPNAEIQPFRTLDDAILALRRSEVDGVIDDRLMSAFSLATTPGVGHLEIVPETLGELECAVGVRKGDEPLLALINETINAIKSEQAYQAWLDEHGAGERVAEVNKRRDDRLAEEARAKEPRSVYISVSKDRNYNFDHYRMANLRFIFRDQNSSQSYSTSPISFEGRVGRASAKVPPGTYTLSLPQFNFAQSVEIYSTDPERVSFTFRLTPDGVVMRRA